MKAITHAKRHNLRNRLQRLCRKTEDLRRGLKVLRAATEPNKSQIAKDVQELNRLESRKAELARALNLEAVAT